MNGAELIDKRCRRSIAMILGVKEREVDRFLPPEVQVKLRKVVIDTLNDFATMAIDVLECSCHDDTVINELWMNKLAEIHAVLVP